MTSILTCVNSRSPPNNHLRGNCNFQDQMSKKTHQNLLCGTCLSYRAHGFLLDCNVFILIKFKSNQSFTVSVLASFNSLWSELLGFKTPESVLWSSLCSEPQHAHSFSVFWDDVQRGLLFSGMSRPTDQRAICDKCLTVRRVGSQRWQMTVEMSFPNSNKSAGGEQSHVETHTH